MKKIIFILIFSLSPTLFSQAIYNPKEWIPFFTGSDTVGSISDVDTVEWQVRKASMSWPAAWNQLSTYITATNKTSEQCVVFDLANDANWTYGEQIRFRIVSPSGTITGSALNIKNRRGALTLFIQPDTVSTPQDTTLYLNSRMMGQ